MEGDKYETFAVESMVRGYHVYKDIWIAAVGEELPCVRETENHRDPFAVAKARSGVTVRHIPRKISSTCSMFLRRGGMINCRVKGERRYSEDLSQRGLEVPCILLLRGASRDIEKVKKLLKLSHQPSPSNINKD